MWGESSKNCEMNCQCSGLITESFKINSGNSATKRKQEQSISHNYKLKINPHTIDFNRSPLSPITPSKRRILGEIQNIKSPLNSPQLNSPLIARSPLSSRPERFVKRTFTKITRIFEERTKFKMSNKENCCINETYAKLDLEEETRDSFGETFRSTCTETKLTDWSTTEIDFTDTLPTIFPMDQKDSEKENIYVPQREQLNLDPEFETLHDLEEEFDADNFDTCTKYEIISTDSPNIISRGRISSSRKIDARNFVFGAPLAENEQSTSFNKPNASATRMLNFEDTSFEFTSPPVKKSISVKKSLKFNETPTKHALRHERSDSSIGSMSSMGSFNSPLSKLRTFNSESTTSMESGFISELEEPFLDIEESSNSPKVANFSVLLSGQIKDNIIEKDFALRRPLNRSLSFNPEASKAKLSLLPILESPSEKRSNKRVEKSEVENNGNKRRKSNVELERVQRPVLQRAFSENNASIMSALARSVVDPDLIGDFSLPFALPLTSGDHSDLKSISCETLASLLRGEYKHSISDFQVIDCRYPYEYEGGHIAGAVNLYTPEQVLTLMNKPLPERLDDKRSILVFHCEFSLERGPKLSRFLRSSDRAKNKENYPSLHYPEVYLLQKGYRAFYQQYPELCTPTGYTAMLDPQHRVSLKKHRSIQEPVSTSKKFRPRFS